MLKKFLFAAICYNLLYFSFGVIVKDIPVRLPTPAADGSTCSLTQCPELPVDKSRTSVPVIASKPVCVAGQLQSILYCRDSHNLISINGEPGSFYAVVADCINNQWMQDKTTPIKLVSCIKTD